MIKSGGIRSLSYIIISFLIASSNILSINAVHKKEYDEAVKKNDFSNPYSWDQHTMPENRTREYEGANFAADGCSWHSLSFMLIDMGEEKLGSFQPYQVYDKYQGVGSPKEKYRFDWPRAKEQYPDVNLVTEYVEVGGEVSTAAKKIKDYIDKGDYVILSIRGTSRNSMDFGSQKEISGSSTTGHFIYVDGSDGKTINIFDSWAMTDKDSNDINDYYSSVTIKYAVVYSNSKKKKEQNSLSEQIGGGSNSSEDKESSSKSSSSSSSSGAGVTEDELTGMPKKADYSQGKEDITMPGELDRSSAEGREEADKIDALNKDMNAERMTPEKFVSYACTVIGIGLLAYTVLLFFAAVFDASNSFLDFQLVTVLTFGKIRIRNKYDPDDTKGMKRSAFFARMAILIAISALLISKYMLVLLARIILFISDKLHFVLGD